MCRNCLATFLVGDMEVVTSEGVEVGADALSIRPRFHLDDARGGEGDLGSIWLLAEDWGKED